MTLVNLAFTFMLAMIIMPLSVMPQIIRTVEEREDEERKRTISELVKPLGSSSATDGFLSSILGFFEQKYCTNYVASLRALFALAMAASVVALVFFLSGYGCESLIRESANCSRPLGWIPRGAFCVSIIMDCLELAMVLGAVVFSHTFRQLLRIPFPLGGT